MPYALCPMPYALCPMPYARRVPHVTEKGYMSFSRFLSFPRSSWKRRSGPKSLPAGVPRCLALRPSPLKQIRSFAPKSSGSVTKRYES